MTRRTFLGQSATVVAGSTALGALAPNLKAAAPGAAASTPNPGKAQLSVCIEPLFKELPVEQRLDQVKAAGLDVFEFWSWPGKNIDLLARKKSGLGLTLSCFCTETAGALVAPGSKERFIPALRESIAVAKKIGTERLIVTVGNEIAGLARAEQHRNIVEALKAAAPVCEDAGIMLVLEPLNVLVNHKGYFLSTSAEGFQIIDEVGSPKIRLLFDIYHQQITEGNLIQNITANIGKIGHFHVADVPGRHQPGTGEINYGNVFRSIKASGYSGYIGLEMWPTNDHATALKDAAALFRSS